MGGTRELKEENRQRILSACVRLFIEQGFSKTPPKQILTEANVTSGTFYNLFRTKSGVLTELTEFMFKNQFGIAQNIIGEDAKPILLYAVETCIQITLAELNENLREIYVEAYTQEETLKIIHRKTAQEIEKIFFRYMPQCTESDFYEMEIGTAGIMRAYMAKPCDMYFTLEHKLSRFLKMTLSVFDVPEDEIEEAIDCINWLDIRAVANNVMQKLFAALQMKYDFTLTESKGKE